MPNDPKLSRAGADDGCQSQAARDVRSPSGPASAAKLSTARDAQCEEDAPTRPGVGCSAWLGIRWDREERREGDPKRGCGKRMELRRDQKRRPVENRGRPGAEKVAAQEASTTGGQNGGSGSRVPACGSEGRTPGNRRPNVRAESDAPGGTPVMTVLPDRGAARRQGSAGDAACSRECSFDPLQTRFK